MFYKKENKNYYFNISKLLGQVFQIFNNSAILTSSCPHAFTNFSLPFLPTSKTSQTLLLVKFFFEEFSEYARGASFLILEVFLL